MWLVFVFGLFILGIIFSKIEIVIKKILINKNNSTFEMNSKFMLFGIIKIFSIRFNKSGIEFLGKTFLYEELLKNKRLNRIRYNAKAFDLRRLNRVFKEINLKLSSAKFTLKVGTEDIFITSLLVVIFSSYITSFFKDKLNLINSKKVNYRILPEFNKNQICFEGNAVFKMKAKDLGKILNLKN